MDQHSADGEFDEQPPSSYGRATVHVLVVAAGVGTRAGGDVPKQYQQVAGKAVLEHSLAAFVPLLHQSIRSVSVAVSPNDGHVQPLLRQAEMVDAVQVLRCGGPTRAQTVLGGLHALRNLRGAKADDWVLVHDAARCLLHTDDVTRLIDAASEHSVGGLLALPLADTLKAESSQYPGEVQRTLDRQGKWLAQTPQMFRLAALCDALEAAMRDEPDAVTDEASAMELAGLHPLLVASSHPNFKITHPQDFAYAQALLSARLDRGSSSSFRPDPRIGEGWDTHALVPGRPLIIGGVHIPHHLGLLGHSDADVLLHAVTDALLGAAGMGDIGTLFPDTDAAFAGADSMRLLSNAQAAVAERGYRVGNVDCTVMAQAPKLAAYKSHMAANIARCLGIDVAQVNVKAKTAERLGPVGLEQSIEARATLLLFR